MIFQIWTNFLVFFVAITLAPGITPRDGLQGYLMAGAMYVGMILLLPKVIEFFKLNVNIASFTLVGVIFTFLYLMLMKNVLFGFLDFDSATSVDGILGFNFFGPSSLDENGIMMYGTLILTTMSSLNQWLMGK